METGTVRAAPAVAPWVEGEPFPAPDPPSSADGEGIRAYEWDAWRALPGLADTRRVREPAQAFTTYGWAVTFHGDFGLAGLVHRVQEGLAASPAASALAPVAPDRVCVPLLRVADGTDLDDDVLADLDWAAREALVEADPLRVTLGPVTAGPGSVRLSVTPWDGLLELHHALRVATKDVLGGRPWLRELTPYRPHVSVAHARADVPAEVLGPTLERLRRLPLVRSRVRRVTLVRVTRIGRRTRWYDAASVPLGPARSF
jgi:hypothetical protein